ncbi:hypothetical protein EBB59_11510 [Lysobacter pythonis]|uniref:Uncharacterized protein n=1 Tax=Solilutibacter pythonis TaxID=2483112 RepID=A0A3M2HQX4_9GAMM|nr:hypothetical protein [Lysobacter pythonis]RMH88597.1 hypothetical protein EBB59_11510 [Lysobacter pythonis]
MKIIDNLFRRKEPKEPWPLRFDSYSFDARCHNTLKCSIIFDRTQFALTRELNGPSGEPHRPDWKEHWNAGFGSTEEFETHGFPSTVDIKWTALDGIERETKIDLETVFPGHEIIHDVPREEIDEYRAANERHHAWIFLEVNNHTINIYIKALVATNRLKDPSNDHKAIVVRADMKLAWSNTY